MAPESAAWGGARRLLRRLRDTMAGPGAAQARLDRIVGLIAGELVAEVCSVYVRRAGDTLELFATEGLRADAVHRTRLRVGEGLVGEIAARARPLALADARSHPLFAFRPETGEEIYASLMGVPILRGGRVLGVLVVQNRTQRNYTEEEVETLETIAMVLAELIAGGDVVGADAAVSEFEANWASRRLEGVVMCAGLGAGNAVLHRHGARVTRLVADDPGDERERLRSAIEALWGSLDAILDRPDIAQGTEHRDVLETYLMIARDRGWLQRIEEAILSGLTAEAAAQKVQYDARARMALVTDAYLRERLLDLEDLTNRLLEHLTGGAAAEIELPDEVVLVARSIGPADILAYDRARLRAAVLEEGSTTSHTSIVARALDLPMIGRAAGAMALIESGDNVLVDADNAQVFIRPNHSVQAAFTAALTDRRNRTSTYRALRSKPAVTRDGAAISLQINAGLLIDVQQVYDVGADGIGLYRTEIPFMVRSQYPDLQAQTEHYQRVFDAAGGKTVVFRTLDVGGDKLLPSLGQTGEHNPAMGWRAMRIALDRPAILRTQLRALITAAADRELSLMFPMVADVSELERARKILDIECAAAAAQPSSVRVGVMVEVPALIWQLPSVLPRVDFLSIGTNDLVQFLFASDRTNPRMDGRYDTLAPSFLVALRAIVRQCDAANVPVTVCGEMAGNPLDSLALIGLGYRALSMPPAMIGAVRAAVRAITLQPLQTYVDALCDRPVKSVRAHLRAFAQDRLTNH